NEAAPARTVRSKSALGWSPPIDSTICSSRTNPVAQRTLMARSALSLQQNFRDRVPFSGQWRGRDRTLRLPVPIARIAEIALHACQIGWDPAASLTPLIHADVVRLAPRVLAPPPQRCQRRREAGGRFCLGEETFDPRHIHRKTPRAGRFPPARGQNPPRR